MIWEKTVKNKRKQKHKNKTIKNENKSYILFHFLWFLIKWLYEILWGFHKKTMPVFFLISSHLLAGNLFPAVEI